MAAISPGWPRGPSRRPKKQSIAANTHRFEPFSKRMARLRIDPVHRVQQNDSLGEDTELSKTHFGLSLNHWAELNLSENFTSFVQKVKPFAESLPQILHHADLISELLLQHIDKRDSSSSEALLSLLAHFAHDLGTRFEKYFAEAVKLVLSVAATHEASEVIEWSFSCLAFMLKYLSRLLVLDLRPLLSIVASYLGKARQKAYVTRFVAESMAFLVRKAGAMYHKNKAPLEHVVSHVLEDLIRLGTEKERAAYRAGLMSLFTEAIIGVDRGVHSSSANIVGCLVYHANGVGDRGDQCAQVLEGVIISIIHETNAEGFSPLAKLIQDFNNAIGDQNPASDIALGARLLVLILGTRKGTRINDWKGTLNTLVHISKVAERIPVTSHITLHQDVITTIAMASQYSPLDALLPFNATFLGLVSSGPLSGYFLPFCLLSDQIGRDRFQSLTLKTLQEFIAREWQHNPISLCLLIRRLSATGLDLSASSPSGCLSARMMIEEQILLALCTNEANSMIHYTSEDALAQFAEDMSFPKDSTLADKYVEPLRSRILESLRRKGQSKIIMTGFEIGRGFKTYVRLVKLTHNIDSTLWSAICNEPALPVGCPIFLSALSEYVDALNMTEIELSQARTLLMHLVHNLLNDAGEVKTLSVRLMQQIVRQRAAQNMLDTISQIVHIHYGLDTVRQITMLIRRLGVLQKDMKSDPLLEKIIPYFCLGLLYSNFAPVVHELHSTISALCEDLANEEIISDISIRWLQTSVNTRAPHNFSEERKAPMLIITRHQCSNVQMVRELVQKSFSLFNMPEQNLDKQLRAEGASSGDGQSLLTRLQALQVFSAIPHSAEKRSRFVVPVFLSMQPAQDYVSVPLDSSTSLSSHTMSPEILTGKWSFPERKAFLDLFGKFKNPRVLFKSQDVFFALLEFLMVGQSEIQKLALKALFTWKLPSIRKYEESLLKLTDEKTYRDELTTIFHDDIETSTIRDEDRSELVPILLRVLYGQMISRSGSNGNHGGQEAKRKITLRMLFRMQHDEISQFLDIAFGKVSIKISFDGSLQHDSVSIDTIDIEKQYGLVRTAESMLTTLQNQLAPFGERILEPILYCLFRACERLNTSPGNHIPELDPKTPMSRNIRRTAIHCLGMIFTYCDDIRWSTYLPSIFEYVIRPRLVNFTIETAQGVSGLLQLFATWADDAGRASFLHIYEESLLDRVADCLVTPSTQDDVKIYVLDQIFSRLSELAAQDTNLSESVSAVLQSHTRHLLGVLGSLLQINPKRKVLDSTVSLLASLTSHVDSSIDVESLINAAAILLGEPPDRVGPKVKGNLLRTLLHLLRLRPISAEYLDQVRLRHKISSLFNYFRDTENRSALAEILEILSPGDHLAGEIALLCSRLNAVSSGKLDEIDYDSRLNAFNVINAKSLEDSSGELWEPIVQNLLYFARAADDFAIRSNAVSSLRRFISNAGVLRKPDFDALLQTIIFDALKKAMKVDSEAVRADHVALFGLLVQQFPDWDEVSDMQGLLAGNDEDASFFNNILHIQNHRRIRAMRRMAAEAERGILRSTNICNFFLPLLEKFVFDPKDDESVRNLRGHAIPTVGTLLEWVEWVHFRAIFRRYKSFISSKPEAEKDVIKLLAVSADALVSSSSPTPANQDTEIENASPETPQTALAKSLPNIEKLSSELANHFVPDLSSFIHQKDESQITSRIPVAITTVKLLKILPQAQMAQSLPPLLLDIAYILRSRSQDSRDIARRTLAEVTTILGPTCIHWILKELRTALARGYQLHVLSYTVHSILVSNADNFQPGDLDHCLDGLVAVVMDDIFGPVGQEKDAEDYVSKMREVKSSKSFDSMELLARLTTVRHLVELIRPLRALLTGMINSKQSRQIDELLRRIGLGLSRNPVAGSRDILMFSYQIIQELYREKQPAVEKHLTNDDLNRRRFLVQLTGANKNNSSASSPSMYKLTKFALDIFRSTLQKHDNLLKAENVHGFLPILGDALVQAQDDVKISAMRTLSAIVKLPMPELDENAGLYIIEAVKVVRDSINTNGEAAQAALKLISAVLRERRSARIRDSDLSYLLHRIMPDLQEPDRQGVTFNFVKAVMARKIMLPEVYDASKRIGMIMVTNHGQNARDAARGIFVHFLLEFPQSKERWNKQIKFLVKNLSYQYSEGRQSVMEAVHILLNKVGNSVTQELISKVFIPLVLIMANDDNSECRQMAGALIGRCYEKADKEQLKSLLGSLRGWVQQSENAVLRKTGLQTFKILFEVPDIKAEKEVPALLSAVYQIVKEVAHDELDESWETLHHALQLFSKLIAAFRALTLTQQQSHLWSRIQELLTYPHPWIQSSAAGLIGAWFHDIAMANGKRSLGSTPLVGSHGLELTVDTQLDVLRLSLRVLKRNWSSKELSAQTVRNVVFLGRCFNANDLAFDSNAFSAAAGNENLDGAEEDSQSDMENDVLEAEGKTLAISQLFTQLSFILRHEPRKLTANALLPKQSSLQLLVSLTHHTPTTILAPLLPQTILPPLAHLTDPALPTPHSSDTTFSDTYRDLLVSASEALDMLQKKVGSAEYVKAMSEAQNLRRERRQERRVKRKVELVRDPEGAAREKRRRVEKEKRRVKGKREGFRKGRRGL